MGPAMLFSELEPDDTAVITSLDRCSPDYRQKLMTMGFTEGAKVRLIRRAPLGDPLQVLIRSAMIALRGAEADTIDIVKVDNE